MKQNIKDCGSHHGRAPEAAPEDEGIFTQCLIPWLCYTHGRTVQLASSGYTEIFFPPVKKKKPLATTHTKDPAAGNFTEIYLLFTSEKRA